MDVQFQFDGLALPHLQFLQSPLQEHLISSWQTFETSGIVIETGTYNVAVSSLVQAKSLGEGSTGFASVQVVQIPAWNIAH